MNNELKHHGVKGMKWGVRNERNYKTAQKHLSNLNRALAKYNKAYNKGKAHSKVYKNPSTGNYIQISNKILDMKVDEAEKKYYESYRAVNEYIKNSPYKIRYDSSSDSYNLARADGNNPNQWEYKTVTI